MLPHASPTVYASGATLRMCSAYSCRNGVRAGAAHQAVSLLHRCTGPRRGGSRPRPSRAARRSRSASLPRAPRGCGSRGPASRARTRRSSTRPAPANDARPRAPHGPLPERRRGEAVPGAVRRRRVPQRRLEVRVPARGVVEHHVHEHLDPAAMRLRHEPLEVVVGAVGRLDAVVVADVVAVVAGRRGHRHQPDADGAEVARRGRVPVVDVVELRGSAR